LFKICIIIVSDCVEVRGVVVRLRPVRDMARAVSRRPLPPRTQFSLTSKQAVFVLDRRSSPPTQDFPWRYHFANDLNKRILLYVLHFVLLFLSIDLRQNEHFRRHGS
jgi:hypothetical protein